MSEANGERGPAGVEQVVRSVMVTYPKPETEAQRRAREALRLPMPVFSFLVESVRVDFVGCSEISSGELA